MGKTFVPWATMGWPIVTGCTPKSEGCVNCWARTLHDRRHKAYLNGKKLAKQYAKPFSQVQLFENRLDEPLHWRKPQRVFVAPMGDLFHDGGKQAGWVQSGRCRRHSGRVAGIDPTNS